VSNGGFWPGEQPVAAQAAEEELEPEPAAEAEPEPAAEAEPEPAEEEEDEPDGDEAGDVEEDEAAEASEPEPVARRQHAPDELDVADGVAVLEGSPSGAGRSVGIVVARFNGEITNALLDSALSALVLAGVSPERTTVVPVPGAFELPLGAMALAKTRRYSCVVALGCVIRGETAHFDFVAGEAASGIQLAALETGVPVSFGVLTVDTIEQARARTDRGAAAVRAALEMADLFAQLREQAKAAG
jgi:6,7-dimethyl-8-ribityllumazine synthase